MSCERAARIDLDAVLQNVSAPESLGFLAHCRECPACSSALVEHQDVLASAAPPRRTRSRASAGPPAAAPMAPMKERGGEDVVEVEASAAPAPLGRRPLVLAGLALVALLLAGGGGAWWWFGARSGATAPPAEVVPGASDVVEVAPEASLPEAASTGAVGDAPASKPLPREPAPQVMAPDGVEEQRAARAAERKSRLGKSPRDGFEPAVILEDSIVELALRQRQSLSLEDLPGNSPVEFSLKLPPHAPMPGPVAVTVVAPQRSPFEASGTISAERPDRIRVAVDRGYLEAGTYVVTAKVEALPRALRYVLEVR